jgi:redox-sensitive bicupin YhaK (pirin superfamily)
MDGQARIGPSSKTAVRSQIALLGPGDELEMRDATPGTRFMLMSGKPYGEEPIFNGPYVD